MTNLADLMPAVALIHVQPPKPSQGPWRTHHADVQRRIDTFMRGVGWVLDRDDEETRFAQGDGRGATYVYRHRLAEAVVPREVEQLLAEIHERPDLGAVLDAVDGGVGAGAAIMRVLSAALAGTPAGPALSGIAAVAGGVSAVTDAATDAIEDVVDVVEDGAVDPLQVAGVLADDVPAVRDAVATLAGALERAGGARLV